MSYSEVERRVYQAQVDYIFVSGFNHTPHAYIDIAGGLVEGTLLSQIMFWFSPTNDGKRKTRIYKDGYAWIAKTRNDWWNEIRITPKQYDRAIGILVDMGLVETKLFKFNSVPTIHIRPVYENISIEIDKWRESVKEDLKRQEKDLEYPQGVNPILPKGENGNSPKVKMDIDERGKSITEITTENNTKITNNKSSTPLSPQGETLTKSEWDFNKHSNVQNVNHLLAENKDPSIVYVAENGRLEEALLDWMEYKDERKPRNKNHYVEKSLIQQIKRFKTENDKYGVDKVIEVVNDSIASNYQGIVWDWLEKENFKKTAIDKKDQDRKEFDELMERWAKKK